MLQSTDSHYAHEVIPQLESKMEQMAKELQAKKYDCTEAKKIGQIVGGRKQETLSYQIGKQ